MLSTAAHKKCVNSARRRRLWLAVGPILLVGLIVSPQVAAAELDPFGNMGDNWVTFENYKPREEKTQEQIEAEAVAAAEAAKPVLSRAVNVPSLPESFSASDTKNSQETPSPIATLEGPATWRPYEEVLKEYDHGQNINRFGILLDPKNLDLRLALPPDPNVKSIPDVRISKPKLAPKPSLEEKARKTANRKAKDKEGQGNVPVEACEALSKMRRRQLEAIESDRRTLVELRQALSDLGLTKRLAFMADPDRTPEMDFKTQSKETLWDTPEKQSPVAP